MVIVYQKGKLIANNMMWITLIKHTEGRRTIIKRRRHYYKRWSHYYKKEATLLIASGFPRYSHYYEPRWAHYWIFGSATILKKGGDTIERGTGFPRNWRITSRKPTESQSLILYRLSTFSNSHILTLCAFFLGRCLSQPRKHA